MNTLKKSNKGVQVKILQGLLNIHGYKCTVDGTFGNGTKELVEKFQTERKLTADGIVGTSTWESLGIVKPVNSKIATIKIPFSALTKHRLLLKNKQRYNVLKFSTEYPEFNFVINAGMFDTKTLANVQDMIISGKLDNGGNYSDKGLAFCNDRKVGAVYPSTTSSSKGKAVDFIGGAPSLISNGVKNVDLKGLTNSYYTSVTKRVCYGCDATNLYIFITLNNCNLNDMINEALANKVTALINVDGGGSQSIAMAGQTVIPTDGRSIPSVLALTIQPFNKPKTITNTTTTSNTSKKIYRVQVGAYSDKKEAEKMIDKLKKEGYDAIIKE